MNKQNYFIAGIVLVIGILIAIVTSNWQLLLDEINDINGVVSEPKLGIMSKSLNGATPNYA